MSWNISLRLNNIEKQIQELILSQGLQNPLQVDIIGNGHSINNISSLSATGDISTDGNMYCNSLNAESLGTSISCAGTINTKNIDVDENISCSTITAGTVNYTSLNPPIGGSQNLQQTLTFGNSAGDIGIDNLGTLNITAGNINITNGDAIGENTQTFLSFNNVSTIPFYMIYGDSQGITNQKFRLADSNQEYLKITNTGTSITTLSSQKLLRNTNSSNLPNQTGYILDSLNNPPMYKQIFNDVDHTLTQIFTSGSPSWIFGNNLYTGDSTYNYGVNYGEILLSYFQIQFVSETPFNPLATCQLYLSPSQTGAFDPTKGNRISFNLTNNSSGIANYTFTSSIPIILYYQNGGLGASFDNLYLNVVFSQTQTITVTINNTNMVITGLITGQNTDPLVFND